MSKPRVATVWLDGCSGCHMSLIDMDERILDIFERADLVYSPLVDYKDYPEDVDVCLVEGAVSSEEDLHKIKMIRQRTKTLVSFGDCAVTSNVPGMRNPISEMEMVDGIVHALERLNQDKTARVAILTGAGSAFPRAAICGKCRRSLKRARTNRI